MIIKKEYSLDEVFTQFSYFDTIKMLGLLYEAYANINEMLDLLIDKDYDAYAFEAEKQLALVEKNIEVFKLGIMVHETKMFDKVNIRGQIRMIGNN